MLLEENFPGCVMYDRMKYMSYIESDEKIHVVRKAHFVHLVTTLNPEALL